LIGVLGDAGGGGFRGGTAGAGGEESGRDE